MTEYTTDAIPDIFPPLQPYYEAVQQYQPLPLREERALGRAMGMRLPDGRPTPWARDARSTLILHNQYLVLGCASVVLATYPELHPLADDMVQVGNIALIESTSNYVPSHRNSFRLHAKPHISRAITGWASETTVSLADGTSLPLEAATGRPDAAAAEALEQVDEAVTAGQLLKQLPVSPRQHDILALVGSGLSLWEIAHLLDLHPQSVQRSFNEVLSKLDEQRPGSQASVGYDPATFLL